MTCTRFGVLTCALLLGFRAVTATQEPSGGDWPQWRGPDRTGRSTETGLFQRWPQAGPRLLWSISTLGSGFGSPAIKGDRLFIQGAKADKSFIHAITRGSGQLIWSRPLGRSMPSPQGDGPRGTPTIDGDRLYVMTELSDVTCLRAADGSIVWHRNLMQEFHAPRPFYLWSESPLVDGRHVFVRPGARGAGVVALDKMTGRTVWSTKELSDEAGYASMIMSDVQGLRTLIAITDLAGVGIRASDGRLLWYYPQPRSGNGNTSTPTRDGDSVFYSFASGTARLGLARDGNAVKIHEIYFTSDLKIDHGGGDVLLNGYLYGFNSSLLTCINAATGKTVWRDRSVGKGSLTYADGQLYLLSEGNVVGLAEATPAGYRENGRFTIPDTGTASWSPPVVSGGRLYIRNQGTLSVYDIRAR